MKKKSVWVIATTLAFCLLPTRSFADKANFPWLSIVPEVGYVFFKSGELEKDYHSKVPNRHGVVVKGHLDLGGDGLALELAPLFTWQAAGGLVDNLTGVGGEITLAYRFRTGGLYPTIGAAFHGVYYTPNDAISRGSDLMARFPFGINWYFAKYLAFVAEGGFMIGATGIRFAQGDDALRSALSERTEYAFILGFDLVIGLRFP